MRKTLVLIRHAHRDTSQRALDNGLSEKGREQARWLKRFFTERFKVESFNDGLWIASSPKLRCLETVMPMAKAVGRSVDPHPDLDEQGARESRGAFELRIQSFLREWENSEVAIAIACSHGDWLPLAIHRVLGISGEMKKGSWFEVETEANFTTLKSYIPTFKYFYR